MSRENENRKPDEPMQNRTNTDMDAVHTPTRMERRRLKEQQVRKDTDENQESCETSDVEGSNIVPFPSDRMQEPDAAEEEYHLHGRGCARTPFEYLMCVVLDRTWDEHDASGEDSFSGVTWFLMGLCFLKKAVDRVIPFIAAICVLVFIACISALQHMV